MIHIVVAGAGIGGLCAALALGRAGHQVTLCERRPHLDEIGAGLQLSPNATRHLRGWGVLDLVADAATVPEVTRIRRARDGSDLARLRLDAGTLTRFGAPFLLVHRADLQRILVAAVKRLDNVALCLGATVEGCRTMEGGVEIVIGEGLNQVLADGLVDAGGYRTALRARRPSLGARRQIAWRSLVPAAALPPSFSEPRSNLWLGRRAHLVHYPLRRGTLINVVAIVEEEHPGPDEGSDVWSTPGDLADLMPAFADWHRDALQLVHAASSWQTWPLFDGLEHSTWSLGRQTRLGDAAHPMLPFMAQGASQAIEDAAVLERAVADHPGDVPSAFQNYERDRRPRARRVQEASRQQGVIYHLDGLPALARDTALRLLGSDGLLNRMAWVYGQ